MERLIDLLKDQDTKTTDEQKNGKQIEIVEKAVLDFSKLVKPLGLERIKPSPGDLFNDRLHEGKEEVEIATISQGHIVSSEAWGYQIGTKIIKRAKVTVAIAPS